MRPPVIWNVPPVKPVGPTSIAVGSQDYIIVSFTAFYNSLYMGKGISSKLRLQLLREVWHIIWLTMKV